MALGSKIRNRIVGFFVIISVVLIALPAMMDNDAERRAENNQAIAIDKNGAITDESGRLVSNTEPDYATLLEEDDSSSGEISMPSVAPQYPQTSTQSLTVSGSNSSYVDSTSPASGSAEALLGNNSRPARTEVLGGGSNTDKASLSDSGRAEVLGGSDNNVKKPAALASKNNKETLSGKNTTETVKAMAYGVQVGAFSQKDKADKVVANLKKAGFKAFSRNVTVNGRKLIRVYAGTANTRDALQSVVEKAGKVTGTKASIVPIEH